MRWGRGAGFRFPECAPRLPTWLYMRIVASAAGAVREGATSLAGRDLRCIGHRRGCAADSRLSGMVVRAPPIPARAEGPQHEQARTAHSQRRGARHSAGRARDGSQRAVVRLRSQTKSSTATTRHGSRWSSWQGPGAFDVAAGRMLLCLPTAGFCGPKHRLKPPFPCCLLARETKSRGVYARTGPLQPRSASHVRF